MPIKLNWVKGKNVGLALIFLGIMGILQVIFIIIAQYALEIGSIFVVVIIPIGVILATFYGVIVIFESRTEMSQYRTTHKTHRKKKIQKNNLRNLIDKINWTFARPILIIVGVFVGSFWITYLILFSIIDDITIVFVIAENAGAILSLVIATYFETSTTRKTR